MNTVYIAVSVLCGLVALLVLVDLVRGRHNTDHTFWGLVAIEVALVVQLVGGVIALFGEHRGVEVGAFVGYLVGALLILPVAFVWSASEKSRSGTAVVLVGVLVIPVLCLRLHDLWSTHV